MEGPGNHPDGSGLLQHAAPSAAGCMHIAWQEGDRFASTSDFYLLLVTFSVFFFTGLPGLKLPPPLQTCCGARVPPAPHPG